jgi:dolichyl-phosphate-mannose-protein mannosyltransferase
MRAARSPFAIALAAIVAVALGLRLWGIDVGLPYVYNVDEGAHFVPRAVGMFDHSYDPGYFINPPALTYVFHVLFWLRWGGEQTRELVSADPTAVFVFARVAVAVLATAAVGLIAWVAVRLFDRRVALVAAALLAVAFLPVHYGHFALNDAALLAPVCLSLAGCAGILRRGRTPDYLLAGGALGIAVAFKYTAGVVVLALVAATLLSPGDRRARTRGLALAALLAVTGFVALNPYALLSFDDFRRGLGKQSAAASDGGGKLGLDLVHPLRYYLGSLLWGLGVIPVLAAAGGGIALWLRHYRIAMVLLPAPLLFFAFMGVQDRFFARWALPVYPFIVLLAAWGTVQALERIRRLPGWAVVSLAVVALGAQSLVYVVHNDVVMTRADTREAARAWMVANIPAGARVVIEPIAPDAWGRRWAKRPTSHFVFDREGRKSLVREPEIEDYERTLRPDLIGSYLRSGDCWVVTGSILSSRPSVTPERAPLALRYYERLRRVGEVVYTASPFDAGADDPGFSFDDSYNWRPLAYARPGPRIVVYRLHGGECA